MIPLPDLTPEELVERVERGADWLDANAPADWRSRIDDERLDMQSGCLCVCGQVFAACAEVPDRPSGYIVAMERAEKWNRDEFHATDEDWPAEHGFVPRPQATLESHWDHAERSEREWRDLDAAWRGFLFTNTASGS
jgi:hypothetical protein